MLTRREVYRQFPVLREITYLNNAAQTPVPLRTLRAIDEVTAALGRPHMVPDVEGAVEGAKRRLASLMNADPCEIAFVPNTSVGISAAAAALPLERGDEVLVPQDEHPSLLYPWLNLKAKGIRVRRVPWRGNLMTPEDILQRVSERTRVIALSHVDWLRGFRHDVSEIGAFCRSRGIYLVVDAIQALGVMPVDVHQQGISVLAAGGYKWLMSGRGNGCLFVARDVAQDMRPSLVGRHGVQRVSGSDLVFFPDARRFHTGAWNLPGLTAFNSSLDLLDECGHDAILQRVMDLTERLIDGLDQLSVQVLSCRRPKHRSCIVSFSTGNDERLLPWLRSRDIYLARRGEGLRVGIHFFNGTGDVDRLLESVQSFVGR